MQTNNLMIQRYIDHEYELTSLNNILNVYFAFELTVFLIVSKL